MSKAISQEHLKAICDVLAHTDEGLTKSELSLKLGQCGIPLLDNGYRNNGLTYTVGLNKRDWLYNCLAAEINASKSYTKIFAFVESALNPASFVSETKRGTYEIMLDGTNKVLMLIGLEVGRDGKIAEVVKASSLDEVDRRVNSLSKKLYDRAIHHEVKKYCVKDYLRKDYYDAVFEAAKGIAQRIREMTGLTTDGSNLVQTAFAKNDPYIYLNLMQNESEISEHNGLRELLESIFHLVRNPAAHTPKINWKSDETKALDVLTLISLAHKYLDECGRVPHNL